ncbi:MAG TPA: FAD-dependent oxidoreductase, partial [Burkholderiaceae bacterium]|nr:FAD-dependent oxidoreductase [Burkholderiaceae bacterium]
MSSSSMSIQRSALLAPLSDGRVFDLLIIGGGATGLGLALDASLRGLDVALLEAEDFAKGTSSRATKLIHGGVRYLAQGNLALVRQALHERRTILNNAPHVAGRLGFVMPSYHCWETPFYGLGLKAYDILAGRDGLGPTTLLGRSQVCQLMPGVATAHLKAGVRYWDG